MKTSFKVLFTIFALLCLAHAHDDCDHDTIEQDIKFLDVEEHTQDFDQGRVLSSASNIRIYPYYGFVDSTASTSYANYIKKELIPPIISYFEGAIKTKYPVSGSLKLSGVSTICDRSTPAILKSGVDADFFIYYDTQAISGTQIAATKYCYLSSGTKRPLISRTMINRNMLPVTTDVLVHEKNMYTLMHELIHAFGFSSSLYKYFIDSNGNTLSGHVKSVKVNGNSRTFLDVSPLTDKLRNHFGCSSLQGALMENSGGSTTAASHFERQVFLYEAMCSGSILGRRISELSLALLEGSGWYSIDYDYAEPFFFGKGQGCSFVTSGSCSFDDFCSGSSRGCSPTGRGGGSCNSDSLSGGCKYYNPQEDYDCENNDGEDYARLPTLQVYGRSAGTKCFTGTLNSRNSASTTSFCFKYSCSGSGSGTELEVQVGSKTITCSKAGTQSVDGYYGSVNCPDPEEFCTTVGKNYCPRNCMGRGSCVNNKCQCNSGFSGIDCAMTS